MNTQSISIPNGMWTTPQLLTGGQPNPATFSQAAAAGFQTIVNLRPDAEMFACGFDEAAVIADAGMTYVKLPVASPDDLSDANAKQLYDLVSNATGPVMVHCASGNRVGALWAIAQRRFGGASPAEALEHGRAAGLTALEPLVRSML